MNSGGFEHCSVLPLPDCAKQLLNYAAGNGSGRKRSHRGSGLQRNTQDGNENEIPSNVPQRNESHPDKSEPKKRRLTKLRGS